MKKLFAIVLLSACLTVFGACSPGTEKYDAYISEFRDVVMTANSDSFSVELISGEREDPFTIDGTAAPRVDFTVVTLTPASQAESAAYSYALFIDGVRYEGSFNRHPFKVSYSFELAVKTLSAASITVFGPGETVENFELVSVHEAGMISAEAAFEIGFIRFKEKINGLKSDGGFAAEIFIRLIKNQISSEGGYFWYVAIVPSAYEVYAVLIDPFSQEILAVRE